MKTLITKEIDGYTVLTGITSPTIDPVATIEVVRPILAETEEFKALQAASKSIEAERQKANEAFVAAAASVRSGKETERQRHELDVKEHREVADKLMVGLAPLVNALEQRRRALTVEHAVYFEPRVNEVHVGDEEAAEVAESLARLNKIEKLTIDGELVPDFHGMTFWRKSPDGWDKEDVWKVGDDPYAWGGILQSDLTAEQLAEIAEQLERERIAAMKPADRQAEKTARIDELATQAALRRSADEIRGMSAKDALAASKAWYDEQVAALEELYA